MNYKDRIIRAAASQGLSVAQLQKELGLSNAHFQNSTRITPRVAALFHSRFPHINTDWINSGDGEMLIDDPNDPILYVPLLPISAHGGDFDWTDAQVNGFDCEHIPSPIRGVDFAITIYGDSMAPEYPSGCIVFVKRIYETVFIPWGKTFVLDTPNGTILKNVLPCDGDESKVICHSVNPQYPDFTIAREVVRGWYLVKLVMVMKG